MRYSVDMVVERLNSLEHTQENIKMQVVKRIKQGLSVSIALIIMGIPAMKIEGRAKKQDDTDIYYSSQLVISEEEKNIIEQKVGRHIEQDENIIILSGVSQNENLTEEEKELFYKFVDMLNDNKYLDKEKAYESLKSVDIVYENNTEDYGYYNKIIGIYSKTDNKIKIFSEDNKDAIKEHEIVHCIFAAIDNSNLPSFFIEGMTELLTNEYFAENAFVEEKSYPYEITMIKMLGDIVGSNVLLETYSKGNINILKEALAQNFNNCNIDKLLEEIDDIFKSYEAKNTVEKEKLATVIKAFDRYYTEKLEKEDYNFEHTLYEYNRGILLLLGTDSPNSSYISYLTENGYYTKTYFSENLKHKYSEIRKKDYLGKSYSETIAKKYEKII